ncbi:MAG TPA: outer membrane lipoprotein carrier protein LolA, partial [Spongiibacteraceae bacterium]|nr:outer membrane lipoprotein carrier protein LolA [Spongiibacteraceae bacterium]
MMRKLTVLILSCVLMSIGSPIFAADSSVAMDAGVAMNASTATELNTAKNWSVSDLMHLLSLQKTRKAAFTEKKYIAALQEPLESSGELSFTAPDRLEKRIIKPKPEAVVLDGDKLLIERRNGRKMTLSLSERPEVSGFVESIRATLVGDRAAL